MKKKRIFLGVIIVVTLLALTLSGCALLDSKVHSLKGKLIGVSYNAEFYDNYGAKFLNVSGERIDIEGNVTEDVMPMLERMVDTKIKMFDKETRRKISNNYRKVGGQFYQW